ncbi:Uncharacterised protein [Vibrio cholerae]|nr:Uncharacterised protein [Vibrio cholerae]
MTDISSGIRMQLPSKIQSSLTVNLASAIARRKP